VERIMTTSDAPSSRPEAEVPASNRTGLGLYASPQEAYEMWKADPEGVHFLDVRTFEEYIFGGHIEWAKNIPLVFPRFDPERPSMPGRPPGCSGEANPAFVSTCREAFAPDDAIIVLCATGGRGALAVKALAQAGFTRVFNMVNGFEGDRVDDPGSVYHGKHMRNGWKNAGLPWGYDFHPDLMWVSTHGEA
jgi:rhodanese-related sulfurtransferase